MRRNGENNIWIWKVFEPFQVAWGMVRNHPIDCERRNPFDQISCSWWWSFTSTTYSFLHIRAPVAS